MKGAHTYLHTKTYSTRTRTHTNPYLGTRGACTFKHEHSRHTYTHAQPHDAHMGYTRTRPVCGLKGTHTSIRGHLCTDTQGAHTCTSAHKCLCNNIQDMQRNLLEMPALGTNSYVHRTSPQESLHIQLSRCPELRRYRVKETEKKGEACTPRLDIQSAATFRLTPPVSR